MAAMLKNPDQKAWADAVRIIFPNAADRGTHVNVSGMALTANAPNKDERAAAHGIPRLARGAEASTRKPTASIRSSKAFPPRALVQSWGKLNADPLPLTKIAALRKQASELIDRVQFDQGPTY